MQKMHEREQSIRTYFAMWLTKDDSGIEELFSKEVYYSECYGPVYYGIEQIKQWFQTWQTHGEVVKWRIKTIYEHQDAVIVEWRFHCIYDGEHSLFDGISIFRFNLQNKITVVKEFQSKAEHELIYDIPISFEPFLREDRSVVKQWLSKSYIGRLQYGIEENQYDWIQHFIVRFQKKKIGFCQYYDYSRGNETFHGKHPITNTYGIDYLIGEEAYLHKGLGTLLVKELSKVVFDETDATQIIVRPGPNNPASCNSLLAAGYRYEKKDQLYELRRENLWK